MDLCCAVTELDILKNVRPGAYMVGRCELNVSVKVTRSGRVNNLSRCKLGLCVIGEMIWRKP